MQKLSDHEESSSPGGCTSAQAGWQSWAGPVSVSCSVGATGRSLGLSGLSVLPVPRAAVSPTLWSVDEGRGGKEKGWGRQSGLGGVMILLICTYGLPATPRGWHLPQPCLTGTQHRHSLGVRTYLQGCQSSGDLLRLRKTPPRGHPISYGDPEGFRSGLGRHRAAPNPGLKPRRVHGWSPAW